MGAPMLGLSGLSSAAMPRPGATPMALQLWWGLGSARASGEREVPQPHLAAMMGVAAPSLCCPLDMGWPVSLFKRLVSTAS